MINTEYKNDKFSIITDYEAFTNSIEETLLISELGLGFDEKEITRSTLTVITGHLTQLVKDHKEIIKNHYKSIGVITNDTGNCTDK